MSETPIAPEKLLPIYGKLYLVGRTQQSDRPKSETRAGSEAHEAPTPEPKQPAATQTVQPQSPTEPAKAEPKPQLTAQQQQPKEPAASPQPEATPATAGGSIKWRSARDPILSFIIPKADYETSACIQLLKKISDALKLPRNSAAFGKLTGELTIDLLAEAPTDRIVLLSDSAFEQQTGTIPAGQTLYHTPALSSMLRDKAAKREAWDILKPLQHGS